MDAGQRPEGYRDSIRRAGEFYGGPGALSAHLATILPQPDDPGARAFLQEVAIERAQLGMSSPGMPGGQMTLGDLNDWLHAEARKKA